MAKKNWRNEVDQEIKDHLETLIEEVHKHREAYKKSKNPKNSQLWCALANVSKQLFDLNLKIKLLEKILKDNFEKSKHIKEVPDRKEREDLMRIASNPQKKKK